MAERRSTRRRFLGTLGSGTLIGVAGCLGLGTDLTGGDGSGLSVGEQPPDFSVESVGGDTVSLRPVEQPTVLFFMATWCSSCKDESAALGEIHEQYGDQVRLITIDADPNSDSMSDLRAFKQQHGGDWPHVMGTNQLIGEYRFDSMDTTYIIDREGVIQYKDTDVTSVATFKAELEKSGETP